MKIPFAVQIFIIVMSIIMLLVHPNDNATIWLIALFIATIISIFENIIRN